MHRRFSFFSMKYRRLCELELVELRMGMGERKWQLIKMSLEIDQKIESLNFDVRSKQNI